MFYRSKISCRQLFAGIFQNNLNFFFVSRYKTVSCPNMTTAAKPRMNLDATGSYINILLKACLEDLFNQPFLLMGRRYYAI